MAAPQLIDGDDQKLWAVCRQPDGQVSEPAWSHTFAAASAYKDEILVPATIHGALLPSPRAVRVPDNYVEAFMQCTPVDGPFCGVAFQVGGRARVRVEKIPRVDSCGFEWIVLEREDGKEWPLLVDENGNEMNGGIGAFRKCNPEMASGPLLPFPPGYCDEIRRGDRQRLEIVPVMWLRELAGSPYGGMRFSEYLPADDFVGRPVSGFGTADEIAAEIEEVLDTGVPEFTCELGDDWQFKRIETEAIDLPAYSFKNREIKRQSYQLALIAKALEETLSKHHSALSPEAVAAFWTSWSVWNHLSKWSLKISEEMNRRRAQSDDPTRISQALQRQAWSFGRMVRASSTAGAQSPAETRARSGYGDVGQSPNQPAALAPDSANEIAAAGSPAEIIPLWARNLKALQFESKLSNHELARLIGPGIGDHTAVAEHCRGVRVPQDRTLVKYAQAFSRNLQRKITVDQIRKADLTNA